MDRSWRKDGVIGRPSLWIAEDFWVLRFRLMVKRGPWLRPQASEGEAHMYHFAGLDVSVKETSICIVDETGRIVLEAKVASEPEALLQVLGKPIYRFKRIGLEAGPLSQWLFSALAEAIYSFQNLRRSRQVYRTGPSITRCRRGRDS